MWEENGGTSYSPNVAYLAHWGVGVGGGVGFSFPIFLLQNLGVSYGAVYLIVRKIWYVCLGYSTVLCPIDLWDASVFSFTRNGITKQKWGSAAHCP